MVKKSHSPEQIINRVREADSLLSQNIDRAVAQVI
jgi:hypothetical protein